MPVIKEIKELNNSKELKEGLFLCLIGTNKIPPHIALIANGKYYSASIRGGKLGTDYLGLLKTLENKEIPTLFLKIKEGVNQKELKKVYSNYPELTIKESCLSPVKDYFELKKWNVDDWNFVFDLVNDLLVENRIENAYHLKMNNLLIYSSFTLKKYTKADIVSLIKELRELC